MPTHPHSGHRERVKKRYLENGIKGFAPHELMEMLLFFGVPRRDTNEIAHRLIDAFGTVSGVLQADRSLLLEIEGVTEHAATMLKFIGDLQRYCAAEDMPLGTSLHSTEERVKFLLPHFDKLKVEVMWMISMDILNRVLAVHQISKGTPTSSEMNIRDVLRLALADEASKVIIAHNHPSGIALPSKDDINATVALAKALGGVRMELVDHLIYARDNDCVSFRETVRIKDALRGIPCGYL